MKETKKRFNLQNIKIQFNNYIKQYWWKLIVIAIILAIDLITKSLIVRFDEFGNIISYETSILGSVLVIMPTTNTGAGFSLLSGHQTLLIVFTFLFLIAISVFDFCFKKKSVLFGIATGLIFAGALGNLIDRLAFNFVRDFIYVKFINFPVFNIADMALTFGIILLAVYILFFMNKKEKEHQINTSSQKATDNKNAKNNDDIMAEKIEDDLLNDLQDESKNDKDY